MSEQAWRRRPAARAASTSPSSASRPASARSRAHERVSSAMAPTAASSGKKKAPSKPSPPPASDEGDASRWRALRQSVHVRATTDASARGRRTARIADLCEDDREKVAQLVRRVVEVGTIHEESEAAFSRERAELQREIEQLRAQGRRDAAETEELGDKLRSTLLSLRGHQERVLVLEESVDAETCARHEAEQTMDMLRAEVDKLRLLVRRQRDEMAAERKSDQERFQAELRDVSEQLRTARAQLMQEREERVAEKQRELDARLKEQAESEGQAQAKAEREDKATSPAVDSTNAEKPAAPPAALDISAFLNTSVELPDTIRAIMNDWRERMEEALSGVATTTTESIAAATHEQKTAVRRLTSDNSRSASRRVTGCAAGTPPRATGEHIRAVGSEDDWASEGSIIEDEGTSTSSGQDATERVSTIKRLDFDACSSAAEDSTRPNTTRERVPVKPTGSLRSHKSRRRDAKGLAKQTRGKKPSDQPSPRRRCRQGQSEPTSDRASQNTQPTAEERGVHSTSNSEEAWTSDSEGERSWRQLRKRDRRRPQAVRSQAPIEDYNLRDEGSQPSDHLGPDSSFGTLYETSLFEVVDAIESVRARDEDTQPRQPKYEHGFCAPVVASTPHEATVNYSHARLNRLKEHMEARERKLSSRFSAHENPQSTVRAESTERVGASRDIDDEGSMDDFEVFNAVKDLYSREVFAASRPIADAPVRSWKTRLHHERDDEATNEDGWPTIGDRLLTGSSGVTSQEIREAVEDDIQALLQEEPLVHDLFLSG